MLVYITKSICGVLTVSGGDKKIGKKWNASQTVNVWKVFGQFSASKIWTPECLQSKLASLEHFTYTVNVWIRNVRNQNYAEYGTPGSSDFRHKFVSEIGTVLVRITSLDHFLYNIFFLYVYLKRSRLVPLKKDSVPISDSSIPKQCLGMKLKATVWIRN